MDYFTKLNTYVSFKVDDEYYAANVAKVLEVIRANYGCSKNEK